MNRRSLLKQIAVAALGPARISHAAYSTLESCFPNRLYQFVWRNWELANLDRMSRVAHAPPQALRDLGASMGLPPMQGFCDSDSKKRRDGIPANARQSE